MKKAQGISINTIIIAAIALLVLVILSVVFTGRMGLWTRETRNCEPSGRCADPGVNCGDPGSDVEDYPTRYTAADCPNEGETCCIIGA